MSHHAVFIYCVTDAHSFTANPSSVCVTTGYRAYGEPARSTFVCYTKSSRHTHYLSSRSGKISCFPTIRGSLLLRRKSSWREVGLPLHRRKWTGATFAISSGMMPKTSRRADEHFVVHCCSLIRRWAGAELLLSPD